MTYQAEHITFRLDSDLADEIDDIAEEIDQESGTRPSRPAVIKMLVRRGVEAFHSGEQEKGGEQ